MSAGDVRSLLAGIGKAARPAGSESESAARRLCSDWLIGAGLKVEEREFTYSAFPGAWGTPIVGFTLVLTAIMTAVRVASGGAAADRAMRASLVILILAASASWWMGRYGTRLLPIMRRTGLNLEARRGLPVVWLIAHLDSKSQPFSLLSRASASVATVIAWACAIVVWGLSHGVQVPPWLVLGLVSCAGAASVPLLLSWVGEKAVGALDNASGVAAILAAVRTLGPATQIGVLITTAEELGLAGARAWVEGKEPGTAINCDGVDDRGRTTITAAGRGRGIWQSLHQSGIIRSDVRLRRNIPGVLLDSTAFSDRGWAACTVSRGNLSSLARIHTSRDCLEQLSGSGINEVSAMIAALAGAIIA